MNRAINIVQNEVVKKKKKKSYILEKLREKFKCFAITYCLYILE